MATIQQARQLASIRVLANASELVSQVIRTCAGNDISNSLGGNSITSAMVASLAQQRFKKTLEASAPR